MRNKSRAEEKGKFFEGLCDVEVPSADVLNYEEDDGDLFTDENKDDIVEITEKEAEEECEPMRIDPDP